MSKRAFRLSCSLRGIITVALVAIIGLGLAGGVVYAMTSIWPSLGAQSIEVLRQVFGNEAVAAFESLVFQLEDQLKQVQYQISDKPPQAPWVVPTPAATGIAPHATASPHQAAKATPSLHAGQATLEPTAIPGQASTPEPSTGWQPDPVEPIGSLAGEGQWSAYLTDSSTGRVVAYRTFLEPDPARPYAIISIVAFDLQATRLHFVLGLQEPSSSVAVKRTGAIPEADRKSGLLLAAFNGGFKTEHGHFGVSVGGITVLPPRPDFGTVAIYSDGRVQLGQWGSEIKSSPDIVAWRQNGPLLVHNGVVNPHTADRAPQDWGYTVDGGTATWRSAMGLSADGRTLYYAAGPSLTLPALARSMAQAGTANAMQLDINPYWTHFDAFVSVDGQLQTEPLMAAMGAKAENRYLKPFGRDFFYVTLISQ